MEPPLHTKGYHQKCMADSFSECVIVLNDFCTRMVDIKAGGNARMPFGPVLLFLVFTQFCFTDDPGSKCGKGSVGWLTRLKSCQDY